MVIGSVATLAILVVAATQIPKFFKTNAGGAANVPAVTQTSTPVQTPAKTTPAPQPAQPAVQTQNPVQAQPISPQPQSLPTVSPRVPPRRDQDAVESRMAKRAEPQTQQVQQAAPVPTPAAPVAQAPAGPDPAVVKELDDLRQRQGLMSIRMETVNGSLRRLSAQQASSGFGPSPELTSAAGRMRLFMDQATNQIRSSDPAAAKKSLDSAERELEKLEDKFGR